MVNKVEVLRDETLPKGGMFTGSVYRCWCPLIVISVIDKRKLIRCQVAIKTGPALLELRLLHGSKLWQLAIDTHFSRCFKPLSQLPKYAFDLDDARYSSLHLSTTAKVAIGSGSFEIPVSILDDVEEKINILFPLSRNTSAEARREITTAVMKAQNQLVLEVLRRHQHLEAADQQVQRALAAMTERALAAERHAESLHAIVVEIEDVLPQFTQQIQLQQQQLQRQQSSVSSSASVHLVPPTEPDVEQPPTRSGSSTPTGLGTISWRKKVELLEDELQKKQTTLERCQRELREQQHLPAFQSKIDHLQQENRVLREMTATLRAEIVALTEQLQEIQQAALAQIETMHEQNPALAEEAAVSLRRSLDAHDPSRSSPLPPPPSSSSPLMQSKDSAAYRVSVDLSGFLATGSSGGHAAAVSPSATLRASGSIFRQPLDLDALSESEPSDHRAYDHHVDRQASYNVDVHDDEQHEEAKAPYYPSPTDRARREHDAILARLHEAEEDQQGDGEADGDGVVPTLERDNWTNKYHAYIQQLTTGDGPATTPGITASSNGALQEVITSLGWSLVEERLLTQLYGQYVHAGHVPGASFSHTHGMSLTKFQKFLKDFHMLAIHPTTPLSAAEQAAGTTTHRSTAAHFTAAYSSGQPLPMGAPPAGYGHSHSHSLMDKQLTHSDVSAIFTVASSTKIIASVSTAATPLNGSGGSGGDGVAAPTDDAAKELLTALWMQLSTQAAGGSAASSFAQQATSSTSSVGGASSSAAAATAAASSGAPKAAFKVHGGHRSAADALDFYHTQHLHGPQPYHQHRFGPAYHHPHHPDEATAASMDASTAAAFAVGHPGGVGVAVGVVNPASALLSLPQFRYALTLVAEKLYARVLQQATGVAPVTLTGKDRVQAIRAMFELLWVRNLSPIARTLDLVPHALSALRVFLVHVHSEAQDLAVALAATPLATGAFPWPQYLPQIHAFFAQRPAPLASMRFALLQSLCTAEHLQLLASLYRTFTASTTNATAAKPATGAAPMVMEPLGMAQVVRPLQAHAYLWHPFNHLPRLAMTFAHFRRLCLAQGLLPYLIGEHQLYALFQEVATMAQLYATIFPPGGSPALSTANPTAPAAPSRSGKGPKKATATSHSLAHGLSAPQLSALQQHWRRQRSFPPVHLPDPIAWFLAEADKDIVFANQLHESVTAPWESVFKASASPSRRGAAPAMTTTTATAAMTGASVNVQYTTHGIDLSGFVVLCGALAMKVFPHVAPTERWLQLLALLHQRNPLHDPTVGDGSGGHGAEEAMVGDGFNFGGVFAQQRQQQQWR